MAIYSLPIAALTISCLALLFTVSSFYWMNWRKGNLHVRGPMLAFAAHGSRDGQLLVAFPIVVFNDGAKPIVIEDMQLFQLPRKDPRPLRFTATWASLKPVEVGTPGRSLATQIIVRGRESLLLVCEFIRVPGELLFEVGLYRFELRGKVDQSHEWICLCDVDINVSPYCLPQINQILRTYHLDPEKPLGLERSLN
jgi:hypothetical protein